MHYIYVSKTERCPSFRKIVMLLFLVISILTMMSGNVRGNEIYTYIAEDGSMVITNLHPEENVLFKTWNGNQEKAPKLLQKPFNFNTRNRKSYQNSTSEDRLSWGRDNALIDVRDERYKGDIKKRKAVKDGKGIESGIYKLTIKKIANNLYQDIFTRIIIKTRDCLESAQYDEATLDWSDVPGELIFKSANNACTVKKVYK